MKTISPLLFTCLVLCSCSSEGVNEKRQFKEIAEEPAAVQENMQYPLTIVQKNVRAVNLGSNRITEEYDSLELTLFNDSSYFFNYYRNGSSKKASLDTLLIPLDTVVYTHQPMLPEELFSVTSSSPKRLFIAEVEGTNFPIIEEHYSCCAVWIPMGHEHFGHVSYFSLDFGWIASMNIGEKQKRSTVWTGDWNQDLVDKLIEQLPLSIDAHDIN